MNYTTRRDVTELDVLGGEFVDDVLGISKGARQPVELGNGQRVTAPARSQSLSEAGSCAVRAGQAVVGVDEAWSDAEAFEGILLSGQVLFVCGYACVANE